MWKVKSEFSTSSILKKIDKDNLKKNMWGKIVAKQKPWGEHYNNPRCFKKKNYEAKSTKTILEKKNHKKKPCRETL